ncbi:uncharacterized protein LOC119832635 [Zerene cesonia]|uniref:uncharacterized protein LOC119832635 n=1 Tax=Zerene cesonia TaxID=33412 RepID=UPI0018E51708|nr:uncharacterized protein LOC119832635 [Zerene cesonia]XP_038212254.1 uncharacterized protein LOC119832635 [Zerene cesonia]
MSARWTNKMTILQDLAYAQGSVVPVDIENPLSYDEKPPREVWEEETEEEYYNDLMANGDLSNGPDIGMIQELLDVVRNANTSPELENNNDIIEISKLNIKSPEPLPGPSGDNKPGKACVQETHKTTPKKKRNRNAAINSLIEAYGVQNSTEQKEVEILDNKSIKLLKPNDFILKNNESTEDKETTGLCSNENRLTSPANMFRKKTPSSDSSIMFKRRIQTPDQSKIENINSTEVYVPSSQANEYYEKYIERSKTKQAIKEDIWTRAERIMMEIDEKRKHEKEELVSPSCKSPEIVNESNSE